MGVGQILLLLFAASLIAVMDTQRCYEDMILKEIPSDHIYYKLQHPIVIGHMGNIGLFQENSLEGIRSLVDIKAGGVHVHVRLTKDHKLIVFQDDNLHRMTGEDYNVLKLPYSEILKMNLLKTIDYYNVLGDHESGKVRSYTYGATAKIPLLSSVFEELRGKNVLIYIEMMPDHIPPTDPLDRHIALKTAELLLKLIKDYNMEKQVLVVSRDGFKLLGLAGSKPFVPSGWLIHENLYTPVISKGVENEYYDFPLVYSNECFQKMGGKGFSFMKNLVSTGLISKVVNASFLDMSIKVNEDTNYFDTTKQSTVKKVVSTNYGEKVSVGVFDVFSWNSSSTERSKTRDEDDKQYITKIVQSGASRIITNDVNRVKRALDEVITPYSKGNRMYNSVTLSVMAILFGKMAVTLLYV